MARHARLPPPGLRLYFEERAFRQGRRIGFLLGLAVGATLVSVPILLSLWALGAYS
jgi:hypothetical protein